MENFKLKDALTGCIFRYFSKNPSNSKYNHRSFICFKCFNKNAGSILIDKDRFNLEESGSKCGICGDDANIVYNFNGKEI